MVLSYTHFYSSELYIQYSIKIDENAFGLFLENIYNELLLYPAGTRNVSECSKINNYSRPNWRKSINYVFRVGSEINVFTCS